jgi:hypothetical protein
LHEKFPLNLISILEPIEKQSPFPAIHMAQAHLGGGVATIWCSFSTISFNFAAAKGSELYKKAFAPEYSERGKMG